MRRQTHRPETSTTKMDCAEPMPMVRTEALQLPQADNAHLPEPAAAPHDASTNEVNGTATTTPTTAFVPACTCVRGKEKFHLLSKSHQQYLDDAKRIVLALLAKRRNKTLKRHDIPAAAAKLQTTRQTIYNWMTRCERHTQFCPDDVDATYVLVNTAGRPEVNRLSNDQIRFAYGLWIKKTWKKCLPSGRIVKVHRPPSIIFVHALVVKQFPVLEGSLTIEHLMQELERFAKLYAITTALAREGERKVREDLLPSFPNDVEGPDDRWQMDARYPPMWIRNGDQICTFAVIMIIDDFSRFKPAVMVIPQIELSFNRKPESVDFRATDVCLLLAMAMDVTKHRPRCIYTDNGSQFKALEHYVPYLTDDHEPPIELRRTGKGRPRGRGKIERHLGLIDDVLNGLPGFVQNKRDRQAWKEAKKEPDLLTVQDIEDVLVRKLEERNNAADDGKPSPRQRYETSDHPRLPAPSFNRLAHLVHQVEEKHPRVTNDGLYINRAYYKPLMANAEDVNRYALAVARGTKALVRILRLPTRMIHIASIDGHPFEEIFPVEKEPPSAQRREEWARTVINRSKRIGREFVEQADLLLMEHYQGIPVEDPVTKLPIGPQHLTAPVQEPERTAVQHDDGQRDPTIETHVKSSRTKTGPRLNRDSGATVVRQATALLRDEAAPTVPELAEGTSPQNDDLPFDPAMDAAAEAALQEYQRLRAARRQQQEQ